LRFRRVIMIMTNAELKKKISEAKEQEWLRSVSVIFAFPLSQNISFIGLSAIYEYINQQIDGWSKFENLPDELRRSKTFFENIKDEQWNNWFSLAKDRIASLEETYKQKLKLEEPAKYWEERAKKLRKQGWWSLRILVGLVVIICGLLGLILMNPPEIFNKSILSQDISISIKWILIYATLLSFMAYSIRALSKTMFSCFHLARDSEERYTLTYFYLSLLKDAKVADSERQLIMQSLFSRADTGLLKEESSPTMPTDMVNKEMNK